MSIFEGYGAFKLPPPPAPNSFPADRSNAAPLLQLFFVCAIVVSYVVLVFVLICSSSLLLLVPREGCAS